MDFLMDFLMDLMVGLLCWTYLLDLFVDFIANVFQTDSHALLLEMLSHLKSRLFANPGGMEPFETELVSARNQGPREVLRV